MVAYIYSICRHCQQTISRYPTDTAWYDYQSKGDAFHCEHSPNGTHEPMPAH